MFKLPIYDNKVMVQESKKNHRSITISKENYEKMVELGDMTRTFDSILTDIMIKANIKGERWLMGNTKTKTNVTRVQDTLVTNQNTTTPEPEVIIVHE